MEREPRPKTFAEHIDGQFSVSLTDKIIALSESGDATTFDRYMKMMEGLLIEGGVEMTEDQLVRLRDILRQHAREIGIAEED
ncbi:MAG: hypothetical protein WC693_04180 [Patescibacteria group bacterium]|jgi:hypothetical protein